MAQAQDGDGSTRRRASRRNQDTLTQHVQQPAQVSRCQPGTLCPRGRQYAANMQPGRYKAGNRAAFPV